MSTDVKALKEAHTTEAGALKKEHQAAPKDAVFEECRKQHEGTSPLEESLEQAKKIAAHANLQVSDFKVRVNQENSLRVDVEGRVALGQR